MADTDWITDRRPTKADGNCDGDVRMRPRPGSQLWHCVHWSCVGAGAQWQHTNFWVPPAPEPAPAAPAPETPTPTPRKFVAINSYWAEDTHHAAAVADDGTAWHFCSDERMWAQYTPLPAREVQANG